MSHPMPYFRPLSLAILLLTLTTSPLAADGPADNDPARVRRVPRLGVELPEAKKKELLKRVGELQQRIDAYSRRKNAKHLKLLPDVQIYSRSVREAIEYQEFFDIRELNSASQVLEAGEQRIEQLEAGEAPWLRQTGLVVRGFVSKLDGSVQPYGLVIPSNYSDNGPRARLDVWFHGRGETLSEMKFISQRTKQAGTFAPPDTIVLHPYGRYSNAFKFAGEVDTLEAIDHVRKQYHVDDKRTSVRGFSMGGAGCWQFAVHYSDRWFAANPGAGFSETPEFLRFFQKETLKPKWWEEQLWHWYDCTDWAPNLTQCPTVAYSGELDIQKQAADIMAEALDKEGMTLTHIIGPQTKHRYHPQARDEVERRMSSLAERGRRRLPRSIRFATYTLKYNQMNWVRVDGLGQHWERTEVDAAIAGKSIIRCATSNVTDISFHMPSGWCPFPVNSSVLIEIDKQRIEVVRPQSDRSWSAQLHQVEGKWVAAARPPNGLRKRHGLQGPIDDALMDSFIFVEPTGKTRHESVAAWAQSELERAKVHWRRHFRGHARVKKDVQVTDEDIANSNLILWGDAASNKLLARISDRLPIRWDSDKIRAGTETFDAENHALIMVYPNPLNPNRYIVINSSFTFRDFAYLNNARQTAKLPDWAVVDVRDNSNPDWPKSRWPGRIAGANFFDERWRLRSAIDVNERSAEKADAVPAVERTRR